MIDANRLRWPPGCFRIGITALAALSVANPLPASAQPAPIAGSREGQYFEYRCGPGQVLVGLSGSAGVLIDNIQAVCGRVMPGPAVGDTAAQGPVFGGRRAQDKDVRCPSNYAVFAAGIWLNENYPHVGSIRLGCMEVANRDEGGTAQIEIRGTGNLEGYALEPIGVGAGQERNGGGDSDCDGQYAVGIRGRAGDQLSAFGLVCGQAAPERTLHLHKRPTLNLHKRPGESATTSIPQTEPTLNKRRRPAPSGGASSDSNPAAEQGGGASIFTDSTLLPPAPAESAGPAAQALSPSPLINGTYATTLSVTDSRCFTQDFRGSWGGTADLQPRPGILIPLQNFGPIFAAPVVIQVQGLVLRQSTQVQMRAGPVSGPVPADFDGAFTSDGSRFNVRFTAGNPICRISGTISGMRS